MSRVHTFRIWRAGEVVWGETMCEAPGCFRPAVLLADFDDDRGRGVPLCVDDADVLLERQVVLAEFPGPVSRLALPDPWEHARAEVSF